MSADTIEDLLAGTCPDPDGGAPLSVPVRAVTIADSLAGDEAALVSALGMGQRLAVVCDPDTESVLGARVVDALGGAGRVQVLRLPARPHADRDTVDHIRAASVRADALVAVGSGTINDLCKYVGASDGKPYCVFATAPSMNGYTSMNAAITVAGHKKSLPARAPLGVFMDLSVLAGAPVRMIRSGLGDSLCRATAQADWLLAQALRGDAYREAPFALLAADEPALFEGAGALLAGDREAMRRLARTLVLSGFGMSICGASMPASQGEHLIGHYAEMLGDPRWPPAFHGEQIGVATVTVARLQEALLDGEAPRLGAPEPDRAALLAHFGDTLGAACWREFEPKRLQGARAEAASERLRDAWDALRARVAAVHPGAAALERVLHAAGAPAVASALGWPAAFYRDAVTHARVIRNRYTFLDLAAQAGRLADFAAREADHG